MSRSYKKNPIYKDSTRKGPTFKSGKQIANRIVRRMSDLPGGNGYRKAFCSYNISDFCTRMSEKELLKEWDTADSFVRKRFASYQDAYVWWQKCYKGK